MSRVQVCNLLDPLAYCSTIILVTFNLSKPVEKEGRVMIERFDELLYSTAG